MGREFAVINLTLSASQECSTEVKERSLLWKSSKYFFCSESQVNISSSETILPHNDQICLQNRFGIHYISPTLLWWCHTVWQKQCIFSVWGHKHDFVSLLFIWLHIYMISWMLLAQTEKKMLSCDLTNTEVLMKWSRELVVHTLILKVGYIGCYHNNCMGILQNWLTSVLTLSNVKIRHDVMHFLKILCTLGK